MLGKKSSEKSAKKLFLYSHEYRDPKRGEKRPKPIFQKHTNSECKKVGKKIVGIMGKKRFLYLHGYRDQKKGGKNARNNLS